MSSLVKKIQLKWVQEVWARPVLRYSVQKFVEIERVQREDFIEVEKLIIFSDMDNQRVRILISKAQEQIHCLKCQTPDRANLSGKI